MADPFRYNFDPVPYEGELSRYGMGPGHRWFDYYRAMEEGPGEEEDDDTTDPDDDPTRGSGPDGGDQHIGENYTESRLSLPEYDNIRDWGAAVLSTPGMLGPQMVLDGIRGTGLFSQEMSPSYNTVGGARVDTGMPTMAEFRDAADIRAGNTSSNPDSTRSDDDPDGIGIGGGSGGYSGGYSGGSNADAWGGSGEKLKNGGRAKGGLPPPRFIKGQGDGRSDSVQAFADGGRAKGQYRLSAGEMVIPADAVSAFGRGSSEAGARKFSDMVQMLRKQHMNRMGALPPPRT